MVPYLEEWASLLVEELIEQDPEIRGLGESNALPPFAVTHSEPRAGNHDEETGWRRGLAEDPAPFRTCLELV